MYREVFGCYPDRTAVRYSDIKKLKADANPSLYDSKIRFVKGLAVEYPLDFLREENLRQTKSFEFGLFILPNYVFT